MRFGEPTEGGEGEKVWWERNKSAILSMPFTLRKMKNQILPEPGTHEGEIDAETRRITTSRLPGWHDQKKAKFRLLFEKLKADLPEDETVTLNDLASSFKSYATGGFSWRILDGFIERVVEMFLKRFPDIAKQIHDDANFLTYYNDLGEDPDEQESELDIQVREVIFSAWISGLITEEWGI